MDGSENRTVLLAVVLGATGVAALVAFQSVKAPTGPDLSWMESASVVDARASGDRSESDAWLEWLADSNEWSMPSALSTRNYVPPPEPPKKEKKEPPKPVSKKVTIEFIGMYVSADGDAVTYLRVDGETVRLKVADEVVGGFVLKDIGRDRALVVDAEGTELAAPFLEPVTIEVPLD